MTLHDWVSFAIKLDTQIMLDTTVKRIIKDIQASSTLSATVRDIIYFPDSFDIPISDSAQERYEDLINLGECTHLRLFNLRFYMVLVCFCVDKYNRCFFVQPYMLILCSSWVLNYIFVVNLFRCIAIH